MNKKILYRATFCLILILALFLRLYKIDTLLPPYWEEVALGYDAYSISQTLRDHHGNFLPLAALESFGDWKPSLYFYAIVPFVKIIGLSVMSVRLPSFLAGMSIVFGLGVLIKQILQNNRGNTKFELKNFGLLTMLVAAISPWAILFSRTGWEVNLATALILWGIISFFKFLRSERKPLRFLLLSILFLVLSMYAYHATRLIAPLLGLGLTAIWFLENNSSASTPKKFLTFFYKNVAKLSIALIFTLVLAFPLLKNLSNPATSQRFRETSIFSNLEIIEESNFRKATQPGLIGKIFYHRYILFGREITKNYLSHFNANFLFLKGDANVRHSIQYMGQLYHIEIIFLLLGFFFVFKTLGTKTNDPEQKLQNNFLRFLLFWLFIGIIPASITHASPHALRILPTMPVFIILIALGIRQLFLWFRNFDFTPITTLKNKIPKLKNINFSSLTIFWVVLLIFYFGELSMFARFYTQIYPLKYSNEWQAGQGDVELNLRILTKQIKQAYLSRSLGRPLMYYWFYGETDPRLVQEWNNKAKKDQGEYLQFEGIDVINSIDEIVVRPAMVVLSPKQLTELKKNQEIKIVFSREIVNLAKETVLIVAEIR